MPSLSDLRCVACRSPGLEPSDPETADHESAPVLACPNCHRSYPIVAEMPVMFSDAVVGRGPMLTPDVVRTVLRWMDLPPDPTSVLRVRHASGFRVGCADSLVATESLQFLRRVHASGYPIPNELLDTRPAEPIVDAKLVQPADVRPAGVRPRCRWVLEYIPRAMPPGQSCLANVRFENSGTVPMRAVGPGHVTIACSWSNAAGDLVAVEDDRTPLPVDVPPGRSLTLPVRVIAPARPGQYRLTLRMMMEDARKLEETGPLLITVRDGAGFVTPPHWYLNTTPLGDDLADQARGVALLRSWLDRQPGPRPLRLLEVGGNAKPVVAGFPGETYNLDVDLLGLQVGRVAERADEASRERTPGRPAGRIADPPRLSRVRSVCADAYNPPFAEGFFDAIVMFATLHHMPGPAALLRRLRVHLRSGGFIGVFCEPIGQIEPRAVPAGLVADLEQGVNKQGFSLAEYAQMFASAGLWASNLVADPYSLKARLVPSSDAEAGHG